MWSLIIIMLLIIIWLTIKHKLCYWIRNGFDHIEPSIPFGNLEQVQRNQASFGVAISELYKQTRRPFIGIYLMLRPALLIRDAELARDILTKNFHSFHDRGIYSNENDPTAGSLFALEGQKWKTLRTKLAPTFTSGKLKNMFSTLTQSGQAMQQHLHTIIPENQQITIDLQDVLIRYAADIIASTIFGLDVNSFKEPNNQFFKLREVISNNGLLARLRTFAAFLVPSLNKYINLLRIPNPVGDILVNIVKQTIEYREKNNVSRKDLMQSLIQLRNSGKINIEDDIWDVETAAENLKSMTIVQCAAQTFIFYIAGLESTAGTTGFCLYELAQNEEILAKVIEDIDRSLENHNGAITYESIQDMKYLELCFKETLRKYPGLPMLNRICTEDYPIPGTTNVIKKGTAIILSTLGIQRDAKYFPDPLKFDPERFRPGSDEKPYNEAAYMPFGDGPRHCIAVRMGKMNVLMGIVMILTKFNIEAVEKKEMEFDNFAVTLLPKGGIRLKMSKKQK